MGDVRKPLKAIDHHPVHSGLEWQNRLGEALQVVPEAFSGGWAVNLVERCLTKGFSLKYQGQVANPALGAHKVVVSDHGRIDHHDVGGGRLVDLRDQVLPERQQHRDGAGVEIALIAIVGFDNAIELSIQTYLGLHPVQRQNKTYTRADCDKWLENFHTKIDFFLMEAQARGSAVVCDKATFIWYHEVRNSQYHVGGATIPQARELDGIRETAIWVFGTLFDVADVKALLDQHASGPTKDLPQRTDEDDRLIDAEYGTLRVAGSTYYTSEILHAFDAVQYSEAARDIRARDLANAEMDDEAKE